MNGLSAGFGRKRRNGRNVIILTCDSQRSSCHRLILGLRFQHLCAKTIDLSPLAFEGSHPFSLWVRSQDPVLDPPLLFAVDTARTPGHFLTMSRHVTDLSHCATRAVRNGHQPSKRGFRLC